MDTADLIAELCSIAGAIMEDESLVALKSGTGVDSCLVSIKTAAADITALALAAEVLHRRKEA